jgi:phytoene synthase
MLGAETKFDVTGIALRRHGKSFHFASFFLSKRHADRATQLYALCRHLDDLADEAPCPVTAEAILTRFQADLKADTAAGFFQTAFLTLRRDTDMPLAPMLDLIDGLICDLGTVRIADEVKLLNYCYQVAGTVGLMMCAVLDVRDPKAYTAAISLGVAMQLTNIARDIGADAALGRRYLPASWVGTLEPDVLLAPTPRIKRDLAAATHRLLALADEHYRIGEAGLGYLPWRARFAILVAARVYREIGKVIAEAGYQSWRGRAHVSPWRKLLVAAQAVAVFAYRFGCRLDGNAVGMPIGEGVHDRRQV